MSKTQELIEKIKRMEVEYVEEVRDIHAAFFEGDKVADIPDSLFATKTIWGKNLVKTKSNGLTIEDFKNRIEEFERDVEEAKKLPEFYCGGFRTDYEATIEFNEEEVDLEEFYLVYSYKYMKKNFDENSVKNSTKNEAKKLLIEELKRSAPKDADLFKLTLISCAEMEAFLDGSLSFETLIKIKLNICSTS